MSHNLFKLRIWDLDTNCREICAKKTINMVVAETVQVTDVIFQMMAAAIAAMITITTAQTTVCFAAPLIKFEKASVRM